MVILNVAELSQALFDFYTGFYSITTASVVVALNVAELSQALVCRVILLYLNCLLGE